MVINLDEKLLSGFGFNPAGVVDAAASHRLDSGNRRIQQSGFSQMIDNFLWDELAQGRGKAVKDLKVNMMYLFPVFLVQFQIELNVLEEIFASILQEVQHQIEAFPTAVVRVGHFRLIM